MTQELSRERRALYNSEVIAADIARRNNRFDIAADHDARAQRIEHGAFAVYEGEDNYGDPEQLVIPTHDAYGNPIYGEGPWL
jgi:hypothetical protein